MLGVVCGVGLVGVYFFVWGVVCGVCLGCRVVWFTRLGVVLVWWPGLGLG